jgi:Ca2+-binding RTX toxin-like protein
LTLSGSSKEVVTNLVGDVSATALSGTLNITTADAGDNGISIATGSAATLQNGGADGNGTITGSSCADTNSCGGNDDRLTGGLGADRSTGGSDGDTFGFNSIAEPGIDAGRFDIITDFVSQVVKMDGVTIDANSKLAGD